MFLDIPADEFYTTIKSLSSDNLDKHFNIFYNEIIM